MSTHDELQELLGAYALDALDEGEAAEVRAHLATCEQCAAEVDEHHEIAAMLANTGGDAPAHLWERIESKLQDRATTPAPPLVPLDELGPRRAARTNRVYVVRRAALLGVAAVAVLVAALVVDVVRLDDRVGRLSGISPQQQVALAAQGALADTSARHVVLSSTTSSRRLARVAVLPSGSAFLVNDGLPALPGGRTYQLWGLVGHRLISLGLLGSDPSAVSFNVGAVGVVTSYAITAEHAGGVVQSSQHPVAVSA